MPNRPDSKKSLATERSDVSRRTMTVGIGCALLGTLLPAGTAHATVGGLLGSIADVASAARVGQSVRLARVVEADRAGLSLAILPDGITMPRGPAQVRSELVNRIKADFAVGDMVVVQGWALSRTEARLCALIALENPGIRYGV